MIGARSVVAVAMAALGACATADTVRDAPVDAGVVQSFDGSYDRVSTATLDTLRQLKLSMASTNEKPDGLYIQVYRTPTAFSWGEIGRIIVQRSPTPPIAVHLYWEKRSQMQITGTVQGEVSSELYKGIGERLGQR